jgi:hypothetical protein
VTTVKNTPEPPKSVTPKAAPPRYDYGRPTSGGHPDAGKQEGTPPGGDAPPGVVPGDSINKAGAPVSTGGTQAGPDIGHGATIVVPNMGDRPSGGKLDATGGGTVGDSGDQGAGPGTVPGA